MTDPRDRALAFLAMYHTNLRVIIDDQDHLGTEVRTELDSIVREHRAMQGDPANPGRRQIYILGVTENNVPKAVVRNYIERALKHYAKIDPQNAFGGSYGPRFSVSSVTIGNSKEHALKQIVDLIKRVNDVLNPFFDRIGDDT